MKWHKARVVLPISEPIQSPSLQGSTTGQLYSRTRRKRSVNVEEEPNIKRAMSEKSDMVANPPHYTGHPSGVECIEITEHMNFNTGNAIKYLWRHCDKNDKLEDLKKARWYIDREIQRLDKDWRKDIQ